MKSKPNTWILVVGRAGKELNEKLKIASKTVGQALALARFGLISADFSGVDLAVAEVYAKSCRTLDREFFVHLYLERERPTRFVGGTIFQVESSAKATIKAADIVILLDGSLGVEKVGNLTREYGKPVIAFGATGAIAQKVYNTILSSWEQNPIPGISYKRYKTDLSYLINTVNLVTLLGDISLNKLIQSEEFKESMKLEFQKLSAQDIQIINSKKLNEAIKVSNDLGQPRIDRKLKLFISYSHKDEIYKEALEEHLSALESSNIIEPWNDRALLGGQDWDNEIKKALRSADIIIFLVSSSFMSSGYIRDVEIRNAMNRHNEGSALIIPVIIRPCDFSSLKSISKIQALPKDAKPISKWGDIDEGFLNVIKQLKRIINNIDTLIPNMV